MLRFATAFCLVAFLLSSAGVELCNAAHSHNTTALDLQKRLFEAIAAKNPDYDDTLSVIAKLDQQQQEERLAALAERNARDSHITALIDSLLASDAYELYFSRFRNLTPDIHRRVFAALPYRGVPGPADIGLTQLELFHHRDSLAALVKKISQLDIAQAVKVAGKWTPPGTLPSTTIYYILDGNADAFAIEGRVCFDLYGVLLSKRPASSRYCDLSNIPDAEIEGVLAHEFQHVFALPHLYPPTRKFNNWQDLWEDVIIRRIVSEGIAMQCNPPHGFKKAIFEDSSVVGFWLQELDRVIGQIRSNGITEDSVRAWLDRSYQESARQLLTDYLQRTYPESDQQVLLSDHIADRPNGIYVLGWWMISHVVASPGGHDLAVRLLATPHQLFRLYNAVVSDTHLKVAL